MSDCISLPERHRRRVEEILREKVPYAEVWVYGSRVDGTSHEGSDLDLVLRAPGLRPIPSDELQALREALRDSNIPVIVETHDWSRLPASFHQEIERNYIPLNG